MAFEAHCKDTPEEKKTGYHLDGKEITLTKKRGHPITYRNPDYVDMDKKIEACALYTVLGDFNRVAELTDLSVKQLKAYKDEPWWVEVQKKIMVEQNEELLGKINSTLDSALGMLEDRILNGDCVYMAEKIGKDGNLISEEKTVRVPIKARDLSQIFHALTHQRNLMRGDPTEIRSATSTQQRLNELAEHFKTFTQAREIEGESKVIEAAK